MGKEEIERTKLCPFCGGSVSQFCDNGVMFLGEPVSIYWCSIQKYYIRELSDDLAESQAKVRELELKLPFAHVENVDSLTVDG